VDPLERIRTTSTRERRWLVASDALGSLAAMTAAAVVLFSGWQRADAVASVVISALILWGLSAW
jgi:cobalt-zinc-cadmium efflux system protein